MAKETGNKTQKIKIDYFDGVNSLVGSNISKKNELAHAENCRSKTIGTLEKREGMTVTGTNTSGQPFVTKDNFGLFSFKTDVSKGLYRISVAQNPTLSISVIDSLVVSENKAFSGGALSLSLIPINIVVADNLSIQEDLGDNMEPPVTVYYLSNDDKWTPLTGSGANIRGGQFDYVNAENNMFLVNQQDSNRYVSSDGTTVTTSSSGGGHLFNTPKAGKVNFYKGRLYLADFIQNDVQYKTTILRSSYPMGIVALMNNDYDAAVSGATLDVTDTKYFYTDSGVNSYDVYRGTTLIKTITVTTVNETSLVATWSGTPDFKASDEIWIAGTYAGSKIFRWPKNPTVSGKDVKQYDTFKLSGGENDAVTMMTNIGNIMLISNKNSMASWNDYVLENFDLGMGCVSKKGYVKTLGILYFLHYTGVYATSGGVPQLISSKVERYINGATTAGKESCAAGKKGRSVFFTLGDVILYRPDGSTEKTLNNVCLEYNIVQQNWFVHTGIKVSEFATWVETNDSDRLEFTDTAGNNAVKEFLVNGVATDDGKEIPFRIDTNPLQLQSDFENLNKLISIATEVDRGASLQTFAKIDKDEIFYPLEGKIVKGVSVIKITNKDADRGMPVNARTVSISLRDSSSQLCKISKMAVSYLPTDNEQSNNEA